MATVLRGVAPRWQFLVLALLLVSGAVPKDCAFLVWKVVCAEEVVTPSVSGVDRFPNKQTGVRARSCGPTGLQRKQRKDGRKKKSHRERGSVRRRILSLAAYVSATFGLDVSVVAAACSSVEREAPFCAMLPGWATGVWGAGDSTTH